MAKSFGTRFLIITSPVGGARFNWLSPREHSSKLVEPMRETGAEKWGVSYVLRDLC
jgi:hypothetical protein